MVEGPVSVDVVAGEVRGTQPTFSAHGGSDLPLPFGTMRADKNGSWQELLSSPGGVDGRPVCSG